MSTETYVESSPDREALAESARQAAEVARIAFQRLSYEHLHREEWGIDEIVSRQNRERQPVTTAQTRGSDVQRHAVSLALGGLTSKYRIGPTDPVRPADYLPLDDTTSAEADSNYTQMLAREGIGVFTESSAGSGPSDSDLWR
jgi:hypothetical protein